MAQGNYEHDPDSEHSDGDRTASELSDYPPSTSCNCGTCPRPPPLEEEWLDARPVALPPIVENESNDDGEDVIVEPTSPAVWYDASDTSGPCSSPSAPQTPDSRVTVSDSSSHNEMEDAVNYDGSDEYAEGDDLPAPPHAKESSSEPEPDPDVSMTSQHSPSLTLQVPGDLGELDPDLGASCEVSNTPPQSPLPMLPRRRVYTSEEASGDELVLSRLQIRPRRRRRQHQWQIPPWEIAPGSRGGQRRTYFVAPPVVPVRRRRRSFRHRQAKRVRLDPTSGAREGPE